MSPGELDPWSPYIATPAAAGAADSPPRTDLVVRRIPSTAARASSSLPADESAPPRGRRRTRLPPRPRNLEPLLSSPTPAGRMAWQSKGGGALEQQQQSEQQLATIPQEDSETSTHEHDAGVSVERRQGRSAAGISSKTPSGNAGQVARFAQYSLEKDLLVVREAGAAAHRGGGGGQEQTALVLHDASQATGTGNHGAEGSAPEPRSPGSPRSPRSTRRSPSRSPSARRRPRPSAWSRFKHGIRPTALSFGRACYTGLTIICGGILLTLAALLTATVTLLKLSIALFPVTGPLLQVYLQLAICWKATELVAPTLRPGLDEAWLAASGAAIGEWLVLHAIFIVLQVLAVRRLAMQRLQDSPDSEDEYDDELDLDEEEEEMQLQIRNAA